jgi:2'-5' RNA ligase
MPRLFIAIEFIPTSSFEARAHQLKQVLTGSKVKWVNRDNFHITLKFLGEVKDYYMNSLIQLLEEISLSHSPFILMSSGFGFYGKKRDPRIIWYGFHPNLHYTKLQSSIEDSLTLLGFEKEGKYDPPHMTLGRVKSILPRKDLSAILCELKSEAEGHPVSRFSLIKSTLNKQGSVYTVIRYFELGEKK